MKIEPLPVTFRKSEVEQILSTVHAGNSCAIVGIGSVGKSNLLRFLQREDVRETYLPDDAHTYLLVYIDTNKLLQHSAWGLFELLLHQLLVELTNRETDEQFLQTIDDLHQRSTEPATRHLALRYVDRTIAMIRNRLKLRLVFLFDEFDGLCRAMSSRGFAALRALRDDYKYHLMYVIATRLELSRLRGEVEDMEAFEELVTPNTIWLGPYSEDDARFMLNRLESRHDISLEEETTNCLLAATGAHPGLLRAAFKVAIERDSDSTETLVNSAQVQDECRRIWSSLVPHEQRAIVLLVGANTAELPQNISERLRRKGIIGGPWVTGDHLFSTLFAEYVRRLQPVIGAHIYVDRKRHVVSVNGRTIRLSPLEYKFVAYLEERRGQVCTREELAQHLYPEDQTSKETDLSDGRLDAVVKRVRKRIEPVPGEYRYVITEHGHGFRLADIEEEAV